MSVNVWLNDAIPRFQRIIIIPVIPTAVRVQ
jgi:hypothetical protein